MKTGTFILLILLTLSAADLLADDVTAFPRSPVESADQVLGSSGTLVSLATAPDSSRAFRWKPNEKERTWKYIVVHHSATSSGSVESIHREHKSRRDAYGNPWLGIGYHFVVGNGSGMNDGAVESTFRWRGQIHGAHSGQKEYNGFGIGICVIGNFEEQTPSDKQRSAVTKLIRELSQHYQLGPQAIVGHNTVRKTACPGKYFPLQAIIDDATKPDTGQN